ncbi:Transcriptional regulatory protein ZraR [Polystyrenella longa]|uniref:Transcriptional regulatory protein ZraR n=1 Tax=Polystyrenella longa TaxID=2528007 RepID=A0A518CKV5_9PLAN|nr:sigma-54 dependent transcriptional regulator [Polystyrenella longa]QDU79858.1 Transcriptional regulatory protein ZraR [Polystyrenella longa]
MASNPKHKLRILFVDDEAAIRDVMRLELPRMGHDVTICEDGADAIEAIKKNEYDAAIIDLRMPKVDGWGVVEYLNENSPNTEFIISTAHGDLNEAIQAVRQGAYDFLPKPCRLFEINNVLQNLGEKLALKNKTLALESRLKVVEGETKLIGDSQPMEQVKKLISRVAPTDSTVLILGETGTGKELVARSIHEQSNRASNPFVAVNCGAIPDSLVESELFGHRKGAFTGADTDRKGLFEVANGGTLFLDELGELNKSTQVKLLRFLEAGEIRRVGDNDPKIVDVRVVCATHQDLQEMVIEETFREDLLFRVNTFEVQLPPLRERLEDIPELAMHLIARHMKRSEISPDIITPEAIELLLSHKWAGNIRELGNVLEHAVILSGGNPITPEDFPASIRETAGKTTLSLNRPQTFSIRSAVDEKKTLREVEMEFILQVLDKHEGDKPKTASELGIALKTLYNKLNQHQARQAG